ncbi:hypothetical protein [Streptomyces sp. NPDC050704]|uniref:hypothetical protein n=1 Tax=Streptomyces sp. NPDC050704 TaxID=3157219 RepID=UPI003442928A
MTNYSNPNTRLTAARYAWDVTFKRGPVSNGKFTTQRIEGSYDRQPGATVGSLLAGLTNWYAQSNNIPAADVTIASYSLREK